MIWWGSWVSRRCLPPIRGARIDIGYCRPCRIAGTCWRTGCSARCRASGTRCCCGVVCAAGRAPSLDRRCEASACALTCSILNPQARECLSLSEGLLPLAVAIALGLNAGVDCKFLFQGIRLGTRLIENEGLIDSNALAKERTLDGDLRSMSVGNGGDG